jgi:hypothetical protein
MKSEKIKVTRNVEIPGQKDEERSTTVTFKTAENAVEMLELCGNDSAKAMSYFNAGRWAEFRTKVSNALANKTPQQRAVDKMVAAFKTLNPALSDAQVRTIVLAMPNMAEAVGTASEVLPAEIDETYFDAKKSDATNEEKTDAQPEGETVNT